MTQAEVGILFGPKMGDELLNRRYGGLIQAIGEAGLTSAVLRVGEADFDPAADAFAHFSLLEEDGSVSRFDDQITVDMLRDFSMARRWGDIPAINDMAVRELFRDKALTREQLGSLMPQGIVLAEDRHDAEEARASLPGSKLVVKPTIGRASSGVSVVERADDEAWQAALRAISPDKAVLVEEFIDTTTGHPSVPAIAGRPHTTRIIALDGEPSVVAFRVGQAHEHKLSGDENEEYIFTDPEILTDEELDIVKAVHGVAARAGNGFSYLATDLLQGDRPYLGEVNTRPAIIEPEHSAYWSRQLAVDSAQQLKRAHEAFTGGEL